MTSTDSSSVVRSATHRMPRHANASRTGSGGTGVGWPCPRPWRSSLARCSCHMSRGSSPSSIALPFNDAADSVDQGDWDKAIRGARASRRAISRLRTRKLVSRPGQGTSSKHHRSSREQIRQDPWLTAKIMPRPSTNRTPRRKSALGTGTIPSSLASSSMRGNSCTTREHPALANRAWQIAVHLDPASKRPLHDRGGSGGAVQTIRAGL